MTKIITQFVESNKFLIDTIYSKINNIDVYGIEINQNLYKSAFHIKPKYLLFSGYDLSKEIVSFIDDNAKQTNGPKIYIAWQDSESHKSLDKKSNVIHIVPSDTSIGHVEKNIIYYPNNLVNTDLFYNTEQSSKNNNIIGFLENLDSIPADLEHNLYPNKLLPIQLFNNNKVNTIHNLGKITEIEKAELLRTNKYYLNLNLNYTLAAKLCGSIVVELSDLNTSLKSISYQPPMNYTKHSEFLMEYILK